MLQKIKKILFTIYKAGDNAVDHDGVEHAGFLAFVALLSLFPFLVFFFAILGALGQTQMGAEFIQTLLENAPPNIIAAVTPRIEEILNGPPQTLLTVSIFGMLWTTSSMVDGLRVSLNKAYHVYTPPNFWLRRLVSIAQVFVLVLFLIVAMFVLVFAPIVYEAIYNFVTGFNAVAHQVGAEAVALNVKDENLTIFTFEWRGFRLAGIIFAMTLVISALYYFLPNVKQTWWRTLLGAFVAAIGWFFIGRGLSYYLSHFQQVNVIYGSLGGVIAFLLFFYLISIVLIYGAELNYLVEKSMGGEVKQRQKVDKKDIRASEKGNRKEEEK